jgi:Type II secretory pathway, component ExeA (predicted ATPase)
MAFAGAEHDIFSDGANDDIYRYSSGAARLINKVCTHALNYGSQNKHRIIDDHMIKRVIQGELAWFPFFFHSSGQNDRHQQDNLRRQLADIMRWQ